MSKVKVIGRQKLPENVVYISTGGSRCGSC